MSKKEDLYSPPPTGYPPPPPQEMMYGQPPYPPQGYPPQGFPLQPYPNQPQPYGYPPPQGIFCINMKLLNNTMMLFFPHRDCGLSIVQRTFVALEV